jgi:hypothetical protein
MQGTVSDATSGTPLSPVIVVNTATQQAVSTDDNGFYSIAAKQGDVIAFSYIGYKTMERAKPPSVIIATQNIVLEHTDYQLKEFVFRPGWMTQYQKDSAERRAIYKVPLRRTYPSPINSPVSAIAEKFNKKAKEAHRFQKEFVAGETEKFIDTKYSPDLVTQLTGFTGDTIGHFMYAYPMAYDFARSATDLEIKMWIRANYKQWIKKDSMMQTAER